MKEKNLRTVKTKVYLQSDAGALTVTQYSFYEKRQMLIEKCECKN